jgi:serine/threonine-protein kinase
MAPQPDRIAHYRILAKLGEGGMGQVYRARDERLGRDVAIKVLPPALANDQQYMARFEREAQTLATLNHPNIAAIFAIEKQGIEQGAIVMELVEGETLPCPAPLDTALTYARQIAEGLEAAHEKGIVHRDLKPANIRVTPDGRVKILDFGLAKSSETAAPASTSISPTMSLAMTQAGMILGTAAYMAPEQARGKPVDKRADIWAFGVVLYEMLTGRQLFGGGETIADTLASVVKDAPDLTALPAETPRHIRRLIGRCLQKDPLKRLRDIGEARIAIEEAPPPVSPPTPTGGRPWLPWAVAAICALATGAFAWKASRPVERPFSILSVDLGSSSFQAEHWTTAISPDGRRVAVLGRGSDGLTRLATRLLSENRVAILAGTENAEQPFFSPDGNWIAFFTPSELRKISVHGGSPVTISATQVTGTPRGGAWLPDGSIVSLLDGVHLFRVSSAGGKPEQLPGAPSDRQERNWRWPQAAADGRLILFTGGIGHVGGGYEDANVDVLNLRTGVIKTIFSGGYFPRLLPTGHLVYVHEGTLFAVKFDADRLETVGSPVPVLDDVFANRALGSGMFTFSETGTFLYLAGKMGSAGWKMSWIGPDGKTEEVWSTPAAAVNPKISPDGKLVVASAPGGVMVYDLQRTTSTRLSFGGRSCAWAPDSKHLVCSGAAAQGQLGIIWSRADGAGHPQTLFDGGRSVVLLRVTSVAPDGRDVVFWQGDEGSQSMWDLKLDLSDPEHPRAGRPEQLACNARACEAPVLSPDGRWIAYAALASTNRLEIFVRPFPFTAESGQWQISTEGGSFPAWSRTGKQLYYRSASMTIMAAPYEIRGDAFSSGKASLWSPVPIANLAAFGSYDVAPDGKRILGYPNASGAGQAGGDRLTMLLNFFDELKRRVP